jgi:hypothetical protein
MAGSAYRDTSDPNFTATTHWIMAGLAALAAGFLGWQLGWPWIVDIEDPDFNSMIIIQVFIIGIGLWQVLQAVRWAARGRRFGATEMEIDGPVPVPLGRVLAGRLRSPRALEPTGDYRITLSCFDIHERRNTSSSTASPHQTEAFPVWTSEITLPATSDAVAGLPFRFQLPASVGPKPVRPLEQGKTYFRFKASINLPGFRRIATHNAAPIGRRWQLDVAAPTAGTGYEAAFVVPVLED